MRVVLGLITLTLIGFASVSFSREFSRQDIRRIIDDNLDAAVADVSAWVQIPSVTAAGDPHRPEKTRMLRAVLERARSLGLDARMLDGNRVVVVDLPGTGKEVLGILVHADVVPAGDPASWRHPPFSGLVKDGFVWGRGALDDKGPIAASLHVMGILRQWGIAPKKTVRLIVGSSEEDLDWSDLDAVRRAGLVPDQGWTADAGFPVINAEKSFVNLALRFPVGEDLSDRVRFSGGSAPNSIPDQAQAWLGDSDPAMRQALQSAMASHLADHPEVKLLLRDGPALQIEAVGKAGHGSQPANGVNAISHLAAVLHKAATRNDLLGERLREVPVIDFIAVHMGLEVNGQKLGLYRKEALLGETTVNLGMLEQDTDESRAYLNIRGPRGLSVEDIVSTLERIVEPYHGRVQVDKAMEPLFVDPALPLITELQDAYQAATGEEAQLLAIGGTTYAKAFPGFVAFGMGMPEDRGLGHAANERLNIERLRKGMEIYLHALLKLATDAEIRLDD